MKVQLPFISFSVTAKNNSNIEKKRGIDRFFWYAFVTF